MENQSIRTDDVMMMFHLIVAFLVVKMNDAQVKITVTSEGV